MQLSPDVEKVIQAAITQVHSTKHYKLMPEHVLYHLIQYLKPEFAENIRMEVAGFLQGIAKVSGTPNLETASEIIYKADIHAKKENSEIIEIKHLFSAIQEYPIKSDTFTKNKNVLNEEPEFSFLEDLTKQAALGKNDPVIGREESIRALVEVLSKKTKSNAILVGLPGVGKTAIVRAIAEKIIGGMQSLHGYTLYSLDVGALLSGTGIRGSFEKRVSELLKFIKNKKIILFVDEIHMLLNTKAEGSADAANMLKPALASGEIKIIGATTDDEFRNHVEKDAAFCRRFVKITIPEPDVPTSVTMLRGLKKRIEAHHGVRIEDRALVDAAILAKRYITARRLPDSAIDLVDTACASAVVALASEGPESVAIREKIWALSLEKASLEIDLKRKKGQDPVDENNIPNDGDVYELNENHAGTKFNAYKNISTEGQALQRIDIISQEILDLEARLEPLVKEQEKNRMGLADTKQIKSRIEEYTTKLKMLEGKSEYEAAEIKNYILPNLQARLNILQQTSVTNITSENVSDVVSRWTGIPVNRLDQEDRERLCSLEQRLSKNVIGQDYAVSHVANALIASRVGLSDPNKPAGVFLFLGPTGVGKTELAKATAYEMFDTNKPISIDCSDYQTEISITKLVGVSAGYVGYNEGGRLTEPIRTKPFSLVLLDELDLAHKSLYGVLYQLFDEGRVVDGRGVEVDFTNTIIIMTSNLGYRGTENDTDKEAIDRMLINKIGPALYNRIDSVVHFNRLTYENMADILELQLAKIKTRFAHKDITLILTDNAKSKILAEACDQDYGARPLKKYLQKEIVARIAKFIILTDKKGNIVLDVNGDDYFIQE